MEQYTSLPYSRSFQNHLEIEQIVKFCVQCDNKILSNTGFFHKKLDDELPNSITICGFCYKCKHHVLPSDCYNKVEFTWPDDNSISFNHIYDNTTIINELPNPLLKKQVKFK